MLLLVRARTTSSRQRAMAPLPAAAWDTGAPQSTCRVGQPQLSGGRLLSESPLYHRVLPSSHVGFFGPSDAHAIQAGPICFAFISVRLVLIGRGGGLRSGRWSEPV